MSNYEVFWDGMSEEKVSRRGYAIYYNVPIPKIGYVNVLKSIIKKFNTSKHDIIYSLNYASLMLTVASANCCYYASLTREL